ncbi:hypothetical protein BBJ28_00004271, partial [Nothophytophthora sp. Chile5]
MDGSFVHDGKLAFYLETVIIPRGNGQRSESGEIIPYTRNTVLTYVNAMAALYKTQDGNPNGPPRGQDVKKLLSELESSATKRKRKRKQLEDRAIGTMQEGYDVKELALLNDTWLSWGTSLHLRTRLDFMMGHSMMSRSEIRRRVQLPDLFCVRWEREGFTECDVLVVIS